MSSTEARRGSLFVIFLTVFIDLLGFGLVLPLLPLYARQFSQDEKGLQLGLLMASFSAMQFIFAPLWGRLSDRIGRRPVLIVGLLGSVIFYGLFGMATIWKSLAGLFVARIGAGIAGATIPTAQAYIADTTTLENRSRGMALIGMAFGLGFTFGPLLGYLAIPSGQGDPGPWPGFAAAILSLIALLLAIVMLPESLTSRQASEARRPSAGQALGVALATPTVSVILATIFLCVFSFAIFETTLSLLIKGSDTHESLFHFSFSQVCLTFAFIGFVLALVQGGIVRRLSGRIPEGRIAFLGACMEFVGFLLMQWAVSRGSVGWLFGALTTVVSGFAFLTPSLNGLLSRRSDPANQGGILGLGQSISALARIVGSGAGIPLLLMNPHLPTMIAAGLMAVGAVSLLWISRHGHDFASQP